jgi:hypothetical protein
LRAGLTLAKMKTKNRGCADCVVDDLGTGSPSTRLLALGAATAVFAMLSFGAHAADLTFP